MKSFRIIFPKAQRYAHRHQSFLPAIRKPGLPDLPIVRRHPLLEQDEIRLKRILS